MIKARYQSLESKILFYIIMFTLIINLVEISITSFHNYTLEIEKLDNQLNQIEKTNLSSISDSVFTYNKSVLKNQIKELLVIEFIREIEIREMNKVVISEKKVKNWDRNAKNVEKRSFELEIKINKKRKVIGKITFYISKSTIFKRILNQVSLNIFKLFINTAIMTFLLFYLVSFLLTDNINIINSFLKNYNVSKKDIGNVIFPTLKRGFLNKREDQFNDLMKTIKNLCKSLADQNKNAFEQNEQLKELNENLEKKVEERTVALKAAQSEALDSARKAGMADVAIGVLHNIGNGLTGVNVRCDLLKEEIKNSECLEFFDHVEKELNDHKDDLKDYLFLSEEGKDMPEMLKALCSQAKEEYKNFSDNIDIIGKKLNSVKNIIRSQQEFSKHKTHVEEFQVVQFLNELIELSKVTHFGSLPEIQKEFPEEFKITIEKLKLNQIIANLIKNAVESIKESGVKNGLIKFEIKNEPEFFTIKISDNGKGMSKEETKKLFTMGFTTKKTGHGFGLHTSINQTREMGGELMGYSEGENQGATFSLRLPIVQVVEDKT